MKRTCWAVVFFACLSALLTGCGRKDYVPTEVGENPFKKGEQGGRKVDPTKKHELQK